MVLTNPDSIVCNIGVAGRKKRTRSSAVMLFLGLLVFFLVDPEQKWMLRLLIQPLVAGAFATYGQVRQSNCYVS